MREREDGINQNIARQSRSLKANEALREEQTICDFRNNNVGLFSR